MNPRCSIVVPVHNDPTLRKCLTHLAAVNVPKEEIEILVVDNNSDAWVQAMCQRFRVRVVRESQSGPYAARNRGIHESSGEVLAFCDADCLVDPDWIRTVFQTLQDPTVDAVMGFSFGINENRIARYEQQLYEENIGSFSGKDRLDRIDTRNVAIKRHVFDRLGGFADSMSYGGDWEFGARMHAQGLRIVYNPAMRVGHVNPTQLLRLLRKRICQNQGNTDILNLHNDAFVKKYLPRLHAAKQQSFLNLRIVTLQVCTLLFFPCAAIVCRILPYRVGYLFFKIANVIAIRLGTYRGILLGRQKKYNVH